jgi:hypothetical protein
MLKLLVQNPILNFPNEPISKFEKSPQIKLMIVWVV